MIPMTQQQRIAYSLPCRLAQQTIDQRFRWGVTTTRGIWSVNLTVNVGLE